MEEYKDKIYKHILNTEVCNLPIEHAVLDGFNPYVEDSRKQISMWKKLKEIFNL